MEHKAACTSATGKPHDAGGLENQDCGDVFALSAFPVESAARVLLRDLFHRAVKKSADTAGDSTLSLALALEDGRYAIAYAGDSPFYLVARHQGSGQVECFQIGLPHTATGQRVRVLLEHHPEASVSRPNTLLTQPLLTHARRYQLPGSPLEEDVHAGHPLLSLKQRGAQENTTPFPEMHIIDPAKELTAGWDFLGLMVCSDGMTPAVSQHLMQNAMTSVLQHKPDAVAIELCEGATVAAKSCSNDDITVAFLPKGAAALAAIADGFDSAKTSQSAIQTIRNRLAEAMQETGTSPFTGRQDAHRESRRL